MTGEGECADDEDALAIYLAAYQADLVGSACADLAAQCATDDWVVRCRRPSQRRTSERDGRRDNGCVRRHFVAEEVGRVPYYEVTA